GMDDLCQAVLQAARSELPPSSYDLVEDTAHPLREVVSETRRWLGFRAARFVLTVPRVLTKAVASGADLLGRAGWRSPLRSTAMTVMEEGVTGDPAPYRAASGRPIASLRQIYDGLTCGPSHRLSARMSLLMPVTIAILSLFWVMSGLLGLISLTQAAEVLTRVGWSMGWAKTSVLFWSFVDIALGLGLLWRPWAARVCLAQAGVALFYLIAATFTVPMLWADPLGPLVKILPALLLPLFARTLLETR
ncbi:DoxX-like family protein, partial [Ruegeria sp.]|uniref:DoxX-like family protein n=1 Tax=Ruegeria sp. TaxID=1879320 RepID=UPI00231A6424